MRIGGRHRFVVIDESKFAHKRKVQKTFLHQPPHHILLFHFGAVMSDHRNNEHGNNLLFGPLTKLLYSLYVFYLLLLIQPVQRWTP